MSRAGASVAAALLLACSAPLGALSTGSPVSVENPSREAPPPEPPPSESVAPAASSGGDAAVASAIPAASSAPAAASSAPSGFACAPPDRGWGRYLPYRKIHGAKVSLPQLAEPREVFDVYVHFHASDAARRGFVHEGYPAVFVGFDLGEGSNAYRRAFEHPAAFQRILTDVKGLLEEHTRRKVKLGRVVLSSWSAGFGATTRIVHQFPERIDGLVLLDSLYAPQQKDEQGNEKKGTVFAPALTTVVSFAKRALAGERSLFLSYSDVPTIGYASTGEVAHYLTKRLHLQEVSLDPGEDPRGPLASLDRDGVHFRGFRGNDAKAHCQHLRLVSEATALLLAPAGEKKNTPLAQTTSPQE